MAEFWQFFEITTVDFTCRTIKYSPLIVEFIQTLGLIETQQHLRHTLCYVSENGKSTNSTAAFILEPEE